MINFECTIFNRYIFVLYINICVAIYRKTSLVAQTVKCLPTMQETWVQSLGGKISWRRKWQPTPVFLPRKFYGWRNLVGYSPWGCKESDRIEQFNFIEKIQWSKFQGILFPIWLL